MMKAVSNKTLAKDIVEYSDKNTVDQDAVDGIVPVFFPMDTWNMINDVAKRLGIKNQEVISMAIERYCDSVEEE